MPSLFLPNLPGQVDRSLLPLLRVAPGWSAERHDHGRPRSGFFLCADARITANRALLRPERSSARESQPSFACARLIVSPHAGSAPRLRDRGNTCEASRPVALMFATVQTLGWIRGNVYMVQESADHARTAFEFGTASATLDVPRAGLRAFPASQCPESSRAAP